LETKDKRTMIEITETITIDESEIEEKFVRSSGPGGQNVNKVASAVQLRFDVARSPSLPEPVRDRLSQLAGSQMTADGILVITAREFRTQDQNRQAARDRLAALVRQATIKPRTRHKTKPTVAARQRRIDRKRRRSDLKQSRRSVKF
jgi:ribosome-associated protein